MLRFKEKVFFFIISFMLLFGVYNLFSVGLADKTFYLQMRRYVPCALAMTIAYGFWHKYYPFKQVGSHLLVFASWLLCYPLFYYTTYGKSANFIDNHFDIVFAAYAFATLLFIHLLLAKFTPKKLCQIVVTTLDFLLLLIPLFQIIYYMLYKSVVTSPGIMAIIQTNSAEAQEYLLQTLGVLGICALILGFVVFFFILYKKNTLPPIKEEINTKNTIILSILTVAVLIYLVPVFKETGVPWAYKETKEYFESAEKFTQYHTSNFTKLAVTKLPPLATKPSTIILVIGESATSDFVSAYHPMKNNTSPWMKDMSATANGFLFQHAYASWGQTVPSLERALTTKNQYNNIEFNESISILDIAKKAGYTTYWFSNQGTVGAADTPITLVAKTADHSAWIADTLANHSTKVEYDNNLVQFLDKVDPTQNNFIVFHFMGSHDSFINRYPPNFTRFGEKGKQDLILNYENSLAYTDFVLENIYKKASKDLNLASLVYFSDHGVTPDRKRMPDQTNFQALRIPLFVYLSPSYENLYPNITTTLRKHTDQYFTNDLIYDLMCGIINIQSKAYLPENSLASPSYKYTRETLTTRLGQEALTKDPGYQKPVGT